MLSEGCCPYSFGLQSCECSVSELCNHSNTTLCPPIGSVLLHHVQPHRDNVVGGVAGSRKDTETGECLVDWSIVSMAFWDIISLRGSEPDVGHLGEQNLWMRFREHVLLTVPSATFDIQSPDECTIRSHLCHVVLGGIINDFEVEINLIDGNHILSGEVLLETSQETLREEESGDPHLRGSAFFDPVLNKLQPLN